MFTEKIAFVFPGQGAQYVGMAQDLYDAYPIVRYTFEQVSDMVHKDVARACLNGPVDVLNQPEMTSLGTFAHSVSIARVIEQHFDNVPLYKIGYAITGHSMGQYSALHCAGSMSVCTATKLLSARSTYMSMADKNAGGMACVVELTKEQLEEILVAINGHGFAAISNHNALDQFVISGQNEALDILVARARARGARISKRLNVAIPAHCALMQNAEYLLRRRLENITIDAPKTNWFSNQTANVMSNPNDVKDALADQMTHGVRWFEIMQKFPEYNITRAYELGPGRVLTGLINRANVGCVAHVSDNMKNLDVILKELDSIRVR